MLKRLAQAGYFNIANGAFYAVTKRALRKKPNKNDFDVAAMASRSAPPETGISRRAVNSSYEVSPSYAKARSPKDIALI
jgi:hypothetical protein